MNVKENSFTLKFTLHSLMVLKFSHLNKVSKV